MHKHLYCSGEDHHQARARSRQQPPCTVPGQAPLADRSTTPLSVVWFLFE